MCFYFRKNTQGSFGVVYEIKNRDTEEKFAMKVINKEKVYKFCLNYLICVHWEVNYLNTLGWPIQFRERGAHHEVGLAPESNQARGGVREQEEALSDNRAVRGGRARQVDQEAGTHTRERVTCYYEADCGCYKLFTQTWYDKSNSLWSRRVSIDLTN